jgi:DNA-directed RNA polymerase specialized sigma24 family protein
MGAAEPSLGHEDLKQLPDEELIRRFCASPPDRDAGEELSSRCLKKLKQTIGRMSRFCPRGEDRKAFLDDALSRASEYLIRRITTFQFKGSFDGWLSKLATNAVLDERRKIVGRSIDKDARPIQEPVDAADQTGQVQGGHALFRSKYWIDPSELVRDREHAEIVAALLYVHGQQSSRDLECVGAIQLRNWEDSSIRDIAEKRGSSERDVFRLFAEDYEGLRQLMVERLDIKSLREV